MHLITRIIRMRETIIVRKVRTGTMYSWIFATVVCLCLQLHSSAVVFAADTQNPHQLVRDGALISLQEPTLAIKVSDSFDYVGRHPFMIRDVAAGERFVFVETEGDIIHRLLIVQFEGFLPGIDNFYRYDLSDSPVVAGYPFRSNGYAFNIVEAVTANPRSESAATYPFLESKGYSVPTNWMQWRSLTVADESRSKEMIIFYVENLDLTGLSIDDLYENDMEKEQWIDIQRELEPRAYDSFRLANLDEDGEPISSSWSSIPVK